MASVSGPRDAIVRKPALATRLRLPGGMLGMVVLIVLVECHLARQDLWVGSLAAREWAFSGTLATRQARPARVLALGDSLVLTGLQPRVMERRLEGTVLNLAVPAGQPPTTFFLLRRAMEQGARPDVIVLDFSPFFLDAAPATVIDRWPRLLSLRDLADLGWSYRDAPLASRLLAARCLPSLRDRFELRTCVTQAVRRRNFSMAESYLVYVRNRRRNGGAAVGAKREGSPPSPRDDDVAPLPPDAPTRAAHLRYIRRCLHLAASRGATVIWLLPPYLPRVRELREGWGAEAAYIRVVRTLQEEFPKVLVVDARRSAYPASVFSDVFHLDRDGSAVLSDELAALIQRIGREGSPTRRWIELPGYAERRIDPRLEDLDESRLALRRAWRTRQR